MGWLERLRGAINRRRGRGEKSFATELSWIVDSAMYPAVTDSTYPAAYAVNAWVYACVNAIAQSVASIPLKVQVARGADWEDAPEHDLQILLDYVNSDMDQYMLLEQVAAWVALYGNAYILLLRPSARAKLPAALQILPADKVEPKAGKGKRSSTVEGFVYKASVAASSWKTYADTDIVHVKTFSPQNPLLGQSPIKPLEAVINAYTAAMTHNEAFFKGGGVPAAVLQAETQLTEEQLKQLRQSWDSYTKQANSKRRPLILPGRVSIDFPGQSPDSVTTESLPRLLRETICAVMGVPPAIVGIYEYANYANAREQTRTFWRNRVLPLASRITSAINEQLAPQYGDGVRVVLETSSASALQPDYAELAGIAAQLVQQGVMTRDEVRETLFGLEPLGGDWGNGWWGSITTVPLAGAETTAAATRAIAAGAGSTEEKQAAREPKNSKAQAVTMRRLSEGGRKALYKGFNEVRNRHERKAKSLVVRWYEGLEAQVLGRLRDAEKALGPSIVRAPKLELLLFSVEEATQALEELLGPELLAAYEAAGEEAMILAELDIGFDMSTQVAERLLAGRRLVMRSIAETAQERLRGSLADGLANGETVSQLTTRALEWAKAGKEVYAETVARTETGVVMNAAALDGYQQAGATHKEWLAIMDDRTRDTHASLDGAVVPIAETFDVGGFAASGPGDPSLPVEEVANCRCTTAPVFEE